MSRTTPVSAVPAGLMHRCPPPQTWAGRLRASRLSSPPQPVSPRPAYRSVYGDGRWPAGFCTSPVLLVAASPWPPAVVSRLAKRPASAGLALTRRTRPRPSCSEEDGPRDPLATRSTARARLYKPPTTVPRLAQTPVPSSHWARIGHDQVFRSLASASRWIPFLRLLASRRELVPDRSIWVAQAVRRPVAARPGRIWPHLADSVAVLVCCTQRGAGGGLTGCLEDTA